jgi:integrase
MDAEVFEVGLFKPDAQDGEAVMVPRVWDRDALARSISWLRHQNRDGRNIYIRPKGEHHLSLIDDLTQEAVGRLKETGFSPAVVVETSPGNFQAWLKHPERLNKEMGTAAARALAQRFGGDIGAADWRHFGRLSGFTITFSPTHKIVRNGKLAVLRIMWRRHVCRRYPAMNLGCAENAAGGDVLRAVYVPGSEFPVHVVQTNGLPEVPLTCFANELFTILSPSSVRGYVRELLLFVNWVRHDSVACAQRWTLYGEPPKVRSAMREYLTAVAQCRVILRPDMLGIRVAYINQTSRTTINVRLLLASLKKLYDVLHDRGFYPFPNPMVHEDAAKAITAFRRDRHEAMRVAAGRCTMPAISGVDEPPSDLRLSENYFRLVNAEWVPRSIDDPDFPSQVFAAGKEYGWSLREICAARTLFESGARISEVFDLTAADWAVSRFMNVFRARSKGSFGCRVKTLIVSQATVKLYRRYFDDPERGRLAGNGNRITTAKLIALLQDSPKDLDTVPIFLTNRGTRMSAGLFRDHYWRPALKAVGIYANPHITRHWFVTNALRNIENSASTEAELNRRKQELIQYMAWRSGERTMQAYEHVERGASFGRRLKTIHQTMRRREREAGRMLPQVQPLNRLNAPDAVPAGGDLAFLLGEDDDC